MVVSWQLSREGTRQAHSFPSHERVARAREATARRVPGSLRSQAYIAQ